MGATHVHAIASGEVAHDFAKVIAADAAKVSRRAGGTQHPLRHANAVLRRAAGNVLNVRLRSQLLRRSKLAYGLAVIMQMKVTVHWQWPTASSAHHPVVDACGER